jgi:carnitine 3-dehydrogenase
MGTNMIYHLAGGEAGMRHMLAQFGPALKWPWTKLEAPELTESLIDRMVEGTQRQAAGRSIRELERLRDDYLVAIQQVLRQYDIGAGSTLRALEERLYKDAAAGAAADVGSAAELPRYDLVVRPEWVDYNHHMSDFRYPQVFGDAMDALYRRVGIDAAYRRAGGGFYTVESQVRHLLQAAQGEPLYVTTQVLAVDAKRLQVLHRLFRRGADALIATGEQLHLHVDTAAAKAAPMGAELRAKLEALRAAHASLPVPEDLGRPVGSRAKR